MGLIRGLRGLKIRQLVLDQEEFYGKDRTSDSIKKWQLERFNEQWRLMCRTVPYFQRLKEAEDLSDEISGWEEFRERIPIMERKLFQSDVHGLTSRVRGADFWRTTGGSTAEPVHIPAWNSEREVSLKDLWYARSWVGVGPSDRLFLIWGHRHLLGKGFQSWFNGVQRWIKDALLGHRRFSAYNLSEKRLKKAAEILLQFKPSYVLGYAAALDRFARVNYDCRTAFRKLGLKVVIATAESFPRADSRKLIEEVLGCPVAMEYGTAETGPLAHQGFDGLYSVFWRHFFLETQPSKSFPGKYEILITTLYPRCSPLVRYRIGDLISSNLDGLIFPQKFETIIGRCNDLITLRNNQVVHSEAFSHVVTGSSSITGYQVVQFPKGRLRLNYVAKKPLTAQELAEIRRRLNQISAELSNIEIQKMELLTQTASGKEKNIYVEENRGVYDVEMG